MDEIDVCKYTNLENLMVQYRCLTKLVPISAKNSAIQALDPQNSTGGIDSSIGIISGLRWIVGYIDNRWSELNGLVQFESKKQINEENEKMQQRIDNRKKRLENTDSDKIITAQTIDTNQQSSSWNNCNDCTEQISDVSMNNSTNTSPNQLEPSLDSLEREKQFQLKPNNKIYPSS